MASSVDRPQRLWTRRLLIAAFILLAWTCFGLLAAFQMYVNTDGLRQEWPLSLVLRIALGNNLLKGIISLPLVWVLGRIRLPRGAWIRQGALYLLLLCAFVLLHVAIRPLAVPFVLTMPAPKDMVWTYGAKFAISLRSFFVEDTWGFCCVVLGFHLWQYAQHARERTLHEAQLQARLASAELQVLKMQLHPHFLFNTLNTIYNLVPVNGREAQNMIARLSDLLRFSLDHVTTEKVTLEQEMALLMGYLEIEKVRFEERLHVETEIPKETLRAEVPNMILQPLVENAIRHGIGKKATGGMIRIAARRRDSRLEIIVHDDGAPPPPGRENTGIGLANTRARLTKLYGKNFVFALQPVNPGTKVTLEIPFTSVNGVQID